MTGSRSQPQLRRAAVYARHAPGRSGRASLDRQVGRLARQVAERPDWCHVATYTDQSLGHPSERAGLCRLLGDAPWGFDMVVVDGYGQLSPSRHDLCWVLDQLAAARVQAVVLRPRRRRRLAKLVANLALADLIGEAAG